MVVPHDADAVPGFVAVIDGSERALRALRPAVLLGDWYGRPVSVCGVTAGPDDRDTINGIRLQLDDSSIDDDVVSFVAKPELEPALFSYMQRGQILVASAFGVWAADGRLHAMLNGLVQHNAPAIIGIGPNVDERWAPASSGPILICVDGTVHAHHVVDQIDPFLIPARNRVTVVHVSPSAGPDNDVAMAIACEVNRRFGQPVESRTVVGDHPVVEIVALALDMQASLVITHSWHRTTPDQPVVASTSLGSVAHAPCPVVILGDRVESRDG